MVTYFISFCTRERIHKILPNNTKILFFKDGLTLIYLIYFSSNLLISTIFVLYENLIVCDCNIYYMCK